MKNFDKVQQFWGQNRKRYLTEATKIVNDFVLEQENVDIINFWRQECINIYGGYAFVLEESINDLFKYMENDIFDINALPDVVDKEDYDYSSDTCNDLDHFVEDLRWNLIQELEEYLAEIDLKIPDSMREGGEDEACIYGNTYYVLEEKFTNIAWSIIRDFGKVIKTSK